MSIPDPDLFRFFCRKFFFKERETFSGCFFKSLPF
jgi:hypothetical protein